MMWTRTGGSRALAVDLGLDAVRVIQVQARKGRVRVDFFAEQGVGEGPTTNLPERQLAALRDLLALQRVRTRRAIAALPTSLVLTRTVQLDRSRTQDPEEQILHALANCLPFDSQDLVFDYWPVGEAAGPGGGRNPEVMVVATQQSVVEKYLSGFEKLHLSCAHLDVAPCAMGALLGQTASRDGPVGTIALTRNQGFFAIADRGRVLFWRPFDLTGLGGGGNMERIGEEVSKCVSHMVGTMHIDSLAEVLLFGEGSGDLVISEYLKKRFGMPVRSLSPFDALPAEAWPAGLREAGGAAAGHFGTAMGLALQEATRGKSHG